MSFLATAVQYNAFAVGYVQRDDERSQEKEDEPGQVMTITELHHGVVIDSHTVVRPPM